MEDLGIVNHRQVFFLSTSHASWVSKRPVKNWLALIHCDVRNLDIANAVIRYCLDSNVVFVCTIGKECEWLHDCFDEQIVWREVVELNTNPAPLTTWHNDFEDGIWFALHAAAGENRPIESVVFIETTGNYSEGQLRGLLSRMVANV